MIKKLKKIYPSLLVEHPNNLEHAADYQWYMTTKNDIFGIKKTELNQKDDQLLQFFLTPYNGAHAPVTKHEQDWYEFVIEQKDVTFSKGLSVYRFILFTLSEPIADQTDFREAIAGIYSTRPAIIWIDQQSGVIIEEGFSEEEEVIPYDEMIEVFTTDFYIDVKFYIGPYASDLSKARYYFTWLQDSYDQINQFSIKSVMNYVNAIPYLLTTPKDNRAVHFIIDAVLQDTVDDEELLRSIQVFLECNSNVSLAAKELYMHRNSLQYRIDKFIEKTNIDVKQFENALSVYLILLLKRHFE